MIVVTGATGNFGTQVVEGLLKKLPAEQVGVSTRDPDRAFGAARGTLRSRQLCWQRSMEPNRC